MAVDYLVFSRPLRLAILDVSASELSCEEILRRANEEYKKTNKEANEQVEEAVVPTVDEEVSSYGGDEDVDMPDLF